MFIMIIIFSIILHQLLEEIFDKYNEYNENDIYDTEKNKTSIIWKRDWAYDKNIHNRLIVAERKDSNSYDVPNNIQYSYCIDVIQERIREFLNLETLDDIKNICIVLGHCPQHISTINNQINSTFSKKVHETKVSKIYWSSYIR